MTVWKQVFVDASLVAQTNVEDLGLIFGLRRSPGEGNGYPLQYSGLENPMDRGAWRATVRGVKKLDTTERQTQYNTVTFYDAT